MADFILPASDAPTIIAPKSNKNEFKEPSPSFDVDDVLTGLDDMAEPVVMTENQEPPTVHDAPTAAPVDIKEDKTSCPPEVQAEEICTPLTTDYENPPQELEEPAESTSTKIQVKATKKRKAATQSTDPPRTAQKRVTRLGRKHATAVDVSLADTTVIIHEKKAHSSRRKKDDGIATNEIPNTNEPVKRNNETEKPSRPLRGRKKAEKPAVLPSTSPRPLEKQVAEGNTENLQNAKPNINAVEQPEKVITTTPKPSKNVATHIEAATPGDTNDFTDAYPMTAEDLNLTVEQFLRKLHSFQMEDQLIG